MRLSNEATLASAASLIRQTSSPRFRPRSVSLKHAAPRSTSAHEHYFGCPVRFASDRDALSISGDVSTAPITSQMTGSPAFSSLISTRRSKPSKPRFRCKPWSKGRSHGR